MNALDATESIRTLSDEELAEYQKFVDVVCDMFGAHAREDEDFDVFTEGGSACDAQLYLYNVVALSVDTVHELARQLRNELGEFRYYWRLRIYLCRPGKQLLEQDLVLWLEIDRYVIFPYRGQVNVERFRDIEEMYRHYGLK